MAQAIWAFPYLMSNIAVHYSHDIAVHNSLDTDYAIHYSIDIIYTVNKLHAKD